MKSLSQRQSLIVWLFVGVAISSPRAFFAADLVIDVGAPSNNQSGPLLVGANVVYSHEDIRSWQDGEKIQALIDSGINNLRYPGEWYLFGLGVSITTPMQILGPSISLRDGSTEG